MTERNGKSSGHISVLILGAMLSLNIILMGFVWQSLNERNTRTEALLDRLADDSQRVQIQANSQAVQIAEVRVQIAEISTKLTKLLGP